MACGAEELLVRVGRALQSEFVTPAQSSEPVSSVAELLALALAARDPDELLCRLCEWWQRATRADEVLIGAATGVGDDWSYARCDRQQPAQPVRRGDHGADGQTHDAGEASSSSEDPAVQSIPLAGTDKSIGVIRLVGSKEAPPPGDWIAVTTSLLAHAGRLEARLLEDKLAALWRVRRRRGARDQQIRWRRS